MIAVAPRRRRAATSRGRATCSDSGKTSACVCVCRWAEAGEVARTLAIDGARSDDGALGGDVWVGMQDGQRLLGSTVRTAMSCARSSTPGLAPFDAVFDPWGALWVIDRAGLLARVDPRTDADPPCRCRSAAALLRARFAGERCRGRAHVDRLRVRERDHLRSAPRSLVSHQRPAACSTRAVSPCSTTTSWVTHTAGQHQPRAARPARDHRDLSAGRRRHRAARVDRDRRRFAAPALGGQQHGRRRRRGCR